MAFINYNALKFFISLKWVLLEIRAPKEIHKSPKAMEQIFAGLHGVYMKSLKWHESLFRTKFLTWFSFEMVGKGGESHFYIRTQEKYKNVVEAQIYAQYPDAEIMVVSDYVNDMPLSFPDDHYDLFGAELVLRKPDAFPIRTYPEFEERTMGTDEAKRIDPLASIVELFSTLHPGEQILIQLLACPVGDEWIKIGQTEIDKIMGKLPPAKKGSFLSDFVFSIDKAIGGGGTVEEKKEEKRAELSPWKQEVLKAIERSFDKLGFLSAIRFIYIGPWDSFHKEHIAGISGSFKQFSSQNLNGFKVNKHTLTQADWLFKKSRLLRKKRAIYQSFRERKLYVSSMIKYTLNTEELATLFHFPDTGVKSPLLPRVEAKKGEPPAGLPIL